MCSMITCTVKAFVAFVRELGSVLCFLPIFSKCFTSFVGTFASFILLSAILLFGGTLCWDMALGLAFRAIG